MATRVLLTTMAAGAARRLIVQREIGDESPCRQPSRQVWSRRDIEQMPTMSWRSARGHAARGEVKEAY